jgi:histidyl-tRNA synthetase
VPLARVVAEYRDKLPKFFKRYQIQPVWRADRPARGRYREFYQCDVDVLGSRSMIVETEICAAASDVLTRLGFNDFCVRINHRKALTGILAVAGVQLEKHDSALISLDKLDKIGREGVAKEFEARGINETAGANLLNFFSALNELDHAAEIADQPQQALNRAILGRIVEFVGDNELGAQGVAELQSIIDFAESSGTGEKLRIDPSLARGLSYYTGTIMEINVKDLAGSLGGGGRYDNLVGMFSGQDVPACGFSLGLERILVVMTEREMFPAHISSSPAEVLVAIRDAKESLSLATELRLAGLRTFVYPEDNVTLGVQYKYGASRGIPLAVVPAAEEVMIRDLRTREELTVNRKECVARLRELL